MARYNPCKTPGAAPAASTPEPAPEPASLRTDISGVQLSLNAEKGGLELRFADKPSDDVRAQLKAAGFRWSRFSSCWYVKETPEKRAWVDNFLKTCNQGNCSISQTEPKCLSAKAQAPSRPSSAPTCAFCGRSGSGVQFAIFNPRFKPFGTACTDCEASLPPDTQLPKVATGGTPVPQLPPLAGCTPLGLKPKKISNVELVNQALRDVNFLADNGFLGASQRLALISGFRGEEKQFFFDKVAEYAARVAAMPKTGETEGQGNAAVAHLHYFAGGQANWYVTEKDKGAPDDAENGVPPQSQAFGLADLFADGGELGYISLAEIISCGGELDLYWTPKPLDVIRGDDDLPQEPPEPAKIALTPPPAEPATLPMAPAATADPEAELRKMWTANGVPKDVQDAIIEDTAAKAQPGAMVGPFQIPVAVPAWRLRLRR